MASKAFLGVFVIALCGVVGIGELIFSKILTDGGWPYFRLGASSMALIGGVLGLGHVLSREKRPRLVEVKWVLLRALFSNGTLIAAVVSLRLGAAPGDVAALTSINIVLAALMGHAVLDERLRWPHLVALAASFAGAALVAQPEFLFGREEGTAKSPKWPGYLMAAFAGLLQACIFICARKSAEVSGAFASSAEAFVGVAMYLLMPLVSPTDGVSLSIVATHPDLATGYVSTLLLLTSVGIVAGCLGSQWCPAAVGATVLTASTMVTGYVAQTLLFGEVPRALTLAGAGLMLAAVCIMAATRTQTSASDSDFAESSAEADAVGASEAVEPRERDQEGCSVASSAGASSLLSFAAAEYAQVPTPVRQRRVDPASAAASPPAATAGAAVVSV